MRLFRSQSVAERKLEDRVWRERFVQNAVANGPVTRCMVNRAGLVVQLCVLFAL
jgi:hypothetical protein